MLRTILINAPSSQPNRLRYLAESCGIFQILNEVESARSSYELQRAVTLEPEIVLLTMTDDAPMAADWIMEQCPRTIVIGIGPPARSSTKSIACRLALDTDPDELLAAIPAVISEKLSRTKCELMIFMPAKAGSGCSTIALNTAACMARTHRERVLLIDADLRSSVLTAMVGRVPETGIEDLFDQMDNTMIEDLGDARVAWHGVDLLMSTRSVDAALPSAGHYLRLLAFAAGRYDKIVVDLPELINPATLAVFRACHKLFVVCTSELPTLTLAQQRLRELDRLKLLNDRSDIVLNRWHRSDLDIESIAGLLGERQIHKVPNDYRAVRDSFDSGSPVAGSKLREAFEAFVEEVLHPGKSKSGIGGALQNLFGMSRMRGTAH